MLEFDFCLCLHSDWTERRGQGDTELLCGHIWTLQRLSEVEGEQHSGGRGPEDVTDWLLVHSVFPGV